MREKDKQRFKSKIGDAVGECWPFMGDCQKGGGYGSFWLDGKVLLAHRVSYELHVGPIPRGMQVLHSCDRRDCINPAHLFLGTQKDNIDDMFTKNRQHDHRGIGKLTERDVMQIKWLLANTSLQLQEIANRYGVVRETIAWIARGEKWQHVTEMAEPETKWWLAGIERRI